MQIPFPRLPRAALLFSTLFGLSTTVLPAPALSAPDLPTRAGAGGTAAGTPAETEVPQEGPSLLVMISVDQLRGDLLPRYRQAFTGGFARLMDQGMFFTSASHAHAVTTTAAGHATLSTGVVPARSGIVGNSWDQRTGQGWERGVYAVSDPESPIVGFPAAPGRSPRNLLRTGLADWVLAADPGARVASISAKDRAAITMAGKSRSHVYWIYAPAGRFVTSSYYRDEVEGWVERFNEEVMPTLLADSAWASSVPAGVAGLARPDDGTPFEGDGVHTTFPHLAAQEVRGEDPGAFYNWSVHQPRADRAVRLMAQEAVENLELGRRGSVDYLALSFSATDYVGHGYGPLSQEQLDNLTRLDRELGEFFSYLDETVGEGRWVVGLSGDHGVMSMPEGLQGEGIAGRRVNAQSRQQMMVRAIEDATRSANGDMDRLPAVLARTLEDRALVAAAYPHEDLMSGEPADSFAVLFRNSYYPGRGAGWLSRFGVEIRFDYMELVSRPTGTTHGSPYWYDRWVPLILMGPEVQAGTSDRPVFTVDLAPTLASLGGIPTPSDLDGKSVYP